MRIACLAWGSLLWKPGDVVTASPWRADGPRLPIEFARVGDLGELATTVAPDAPDVQVSWALLATSDLATAREHLRRREAIPVERVDGIGSVPGIDGGSPYDARVRAWAAGHGLDAVVWTALPPRYAGIEGRTPTVDEAVDYLSALSGDVRTHAEDYVRSVPRGFRTPYRAVIEARLGWRPRVD